MATYTEIPLSASQASLFSVAFAGITYQMRLTYDTAQAGCWMLDIGDAAGNLMIAGQPLVSGVDLLAQYAYMGFGGSLICTTDRGAGEVPTFDGLGITSHLYFVTPQ